MSVARSSTRVLEQIVDRAHDRRAAREIAQALDVVVGARGRGLVGRRPRPSSSSPSRSASTVAMSSNEATSTSTGAAEHDLGGAHGRDVGRIGDRQPEPSVGVLIGKTSVSRRKRRENFAASGVAASSCGRVSARQPIEARDLVGEVVGRQIGRLPKVAQRSCRRCRRRLNSSFDSKSPALKCLLLKYSSKLVYNICGHGRYLLTAAGPCFSVLRIEFPA